MWLRFLPERLTLSAAEADGKTPVALSAVLREEAVWKPSLGPGKPACVDCEGLAQ